LQMTLNPPVIVDLGTGYLKTGVAGSNFPVSTFPTIVGRPILRKGASSSLDDLKLETDYAVGDICEESAGSLDTIFPVHQGVIRDKENMKHVWDYTFNEVLKDHLEPLSAPNNNSILITEAVNNPKSSRANIYKTLFEEYNFARVKIVPQALLTLYAQGLQTGVVVDSGDGVTHVMPVTKGFIIPNAVQRLNIAGSHITERLTTLLQMGGYHLNSSADKVLVRKIKEKFCFVAGDKDMMSKLEEETCALRVEYSMDNGEKIYLEKERYMAPECLFEPGLIGRSDKGVHELTYESVYNRNVSLGSRKELMAHIVLSGGTTMLRGFSTRLQKEVSDLCLEKTFRGDEKAMKDFKIGVEDPARRKILVYHGASIFANIIKDQDSEWVHKKDWEEKGEALVE